MRNTIDFTKVSYFRRGNEDPLLDTEAKKHVPDLSDGEGILGYRLDPASVVIEESTKNILATRVRTAKEKDVSVEQVRPWAGGKKGYLIAFTEAGQPLFVVDLQTTTPLDVAFHRVWSISEDLVRTARETEFSEAFYFELTDATMGAEMFAILFELTL